jgi:hypothetical protein
MHQISANYRIKHAFQVFLLKYFSKCGIFASQNARERRII